MKIAILSRSRSLYSTRRLREAGKARGHTMLVVDPLRCYMNIATLHPTVHFNGKPLDDLDAVIPRIGASITFYGTARFLGEDVAKVHDPVWGVLGTLGDSQCYLGVQAKVAAVHAALAKRIRFAQAIVQQPSD